MPSQIVFFYIHVHLWIFSSVSSHRQNHKLRQVFSSKQRIFGNHGSTLSQATDMCIVHSELRTITFLHLTAASSYCANGWTETNFKKCLKFVNTPIKSWDDAQAACRSLGANLLTLNTPDEVEYIKTMRTLLPGKQSSF